MGSVPSQDKGPRGSAPKRQQYMSAFEKLGGPEHHQMYLYRPAPGKRVSDNVATSQAEPDLIIICSWMAASARHINKYTDQYLERYGSVPILLIRSSELDVLFKRERLQVNDLVPAVTAIRSVTAGIEGRPKVLLHVFSNGGSWSATMLSRAYDKVTEGSMLPVSALILDSCPSFPRMRLSHRALSTVLPKAFPLYHFGSMLLWIFLFIIRIFNQLHVTDNLILTIRHVLNDPTGPFLKTEIPRTYICSHTDAMVPIEDVRSHASEARKIMTQAGMQEEDVHRQIRLEEFEGSRHVEHLKVNPERYWIIVRKTWEQAMSTKRMEAMDDQLQQPAKAKTTKQQ